MSTGQTGYPTNTYSATGMTTAGQQQYGAAGQQQYGAAPRTNTYGAQQPPSAYGGGYQQQQQQYRPQQQYQQRPPTAPTTGGGLASRFSNFGRSSTIGRGSAGRPSSPYSSSSYAYGQQRKKPSKKTLLGLLFLVCLLAWVCLSD